MDTSRWLSRREGQQPCRKSLSRGRRRDDSGCPYIVELGEHAAKIRVAECGEEVITRRLAVCAVDRVHHGHAFRYASDGRESLRVEVRIVGEIDEQLMRSRICTIGGEDKCAAGVFLDERIVGDSLRVPHLVELSIVVHAELRNESWDDAEKTILVKQDSRI